jgi:DNA-binding response OmpR family regulator
MTESKRQPLRVLLVEDSDSDAELVVHQLEQAGYEPTWSRVQNESDFVAALDPQLDVILADFNLPGFSAPRALELLKARDVGVPMIIVSGSIGEETAVEVLHGGAADYLLRIAWRGLARRCNGSSTSDAQRAKNKRRKRPLEKPRSGHGSR